MSLNMFPTVGSYLSQTQDPVTDSSGGTASDTLAAISASPTQAEVANSIATLAAELEKVRVDVAAIITALNKANGA